LGDTFTKVKQGDGEMKIAKLAAVLLMALALTLVAVASATAAPAESNHAAAYAVSTQPLDDPAPEPTETLELTETQQFTHPIGLAISLFFDVPYTQVMELHSEGIGFGVIARVYLTADASNGTLTPGQVLALFQTGMGWGEIGKEYGVQPGGKGLGSIMRNHSSNGPTANPSGNAKSTCPGNSCNAPGHNKIKPNKPQ
jgi:hypothetical protein